MKVKDLLEGIKDYQQLSKGVFLATRDTMQREQAKWDDGDLCKDFDFSIAPYWLTTDDGIIPVPIYDMEDLHDVDMSDVVV